MDLEQNRYKVRARAIRTAGREDFARLDLVPGGETLLEGRYDVDGGDRRRRMF